MNRMMRAGAILLFVLTTAPVASAQIRKVAIKVDGLACAFCAYGLEKSLKKIEGVENVKVYVDAGRAELQLKPRTAVALEDIPPTVKQAGYTPREIRIEATGRLLDWNGALALSVEPGNTRFLLGENKKRQELHASLKEQATGALVTISGLIRQEAPENHHGHPWTLYVERFEVK